MHVRGAETLAANPERLAASVRPAAGMVFVPGAMAPLVLCAPVAWGPGRAVGVQYSPWREWPAVGSAAMAALSVWQYGYCIVPPAEGALHCLVILR